VTACRARLQTIGQIDLEAKAGAAIEGPQSNAKRVNSF
jgi:hypothetical protein